MVKNLVTEFEAFILKNTLFGKNDKLLIAVSGGVDSVVLVHLLDSLDYSFAMAHCNFQLRGKESEKDELLVENLGKSLEISCHSKKFNTSRHAKTNQVSIQLAARELRYTWFEELMNEYGYSFLLTAHHANDQVETVLYNLTKGTGIAGLRGIPVSKDKIIRPLLPVSRLVIDKYANENDLNWREDQSNQEDKYSRNKLRLNVIPELKKINPNIEQTFINNTTRFFSLEKLLLHQVEIIRKSHITHNNEQVSIETSWYDENKGGFILLSEILKPYKFNFDQCQSISVSLLNSKKLNSGKQFYSQHHVLTIDRESVNISPCRKSSYFSIEINEDIRRISTPHSQFEFQISNEPSKWSNNKRIAYLDLDKVSFPIKARNWRQGDAFFPLGMKSKKKLSDFMIDEKIPLNLKSHIVLFESGEDIIWVAGHRIDDRYKLSSQSKRVLIITMIENA